MTCHSSLPELLPWLYHTVRGGVFKPVFAIEFISMTSFSIILQAGGKSTRMGTDKALVPFLGRTLIGHILHQVAPLSDDIAIIANHPQPYEAYGVPVFQDVYPDWGALGGLHAAVHHARRDLCLVLACDMPFIVPEFLSFLVEEAEGFDAVIPILEETGFTEPFRAVYRKTCLLHIEQAIKNEKRRVNSFFDQVRVRYVNQVEIEAFDPALRTFFNINTPEELQRATEIALRER